MEESGFASSPVRKASGAALFFFAIVGFVASIVTIVAFLKPDSAGALHVEITPSYFQIPMEVASPFGEGESARRMLSDLRRSACESNRQTLQSGEERREDQAGNEERSSNSETSNLCEDARATDRAVAWLVAYSSGPGTLYRYEITNNGTRLAQQIRITSENVASLQIRRGGNFLNIIEDDQGEYYQLPDLNPRESLSVLVWTVNPRYGLLYQGAEDAPRVTFSGHLVTTEFLKHVPDGWWNMYDFTRNLPTIFVIVFVVALAFVIVFTIIFVIAIMDAIIRGKPLSSVFQTQKKQDSNDGSGEDA
ncbi:MAG: hypothetical protein KF780_03515 [Sphingomonas sp.]|nr:hypothetical protein [Sphingomonas sp.]